jgi:hypothetical protein
MPEGQLGQENPGIKFLEKPFHNVFFIPAAYQSKKAGHYPVYLK